MRNISFSLTTPQFVAGDKTVTRRLGWKFLKPGDRLMAVEKAQGLRKGEKVKRLGVIEVVGVRREPLRSIAYGAGETAREGFPHMTPAEFVAFFCVANKCESDTEVTRISFRKLGECEL
ncbi:MAG: hypothetical protein LBP68_06435 [Acidobacteriota bacterium]|jgi:hypothetical protein|nr:hypothetical protein [Acidobacteriota bacterium]